MIVKHSKRYIRLMTPNPLSANPIANKEEMRTEVNSKMNIFLNANFLIRIE